MTPTEAQQFSRTSATNAATVKMALPCGCVPYQDVFTYNRWLAQAMQVQKGQRAIRLPLIKIIANDDGTEKKYLGKSAVFCRHQVAPTGKAPSNTFQAPLPVSPPKVTKAPKPSITDSIMSTWEVL